MFSSPEISAMCLINKKGREERKEGQGGCLGLEQAISPEGEREWREKAVSLPRSMSAYFFVRLFPFLFRNSRNNCLFQWPSKKTLLWWSLLTQVMQRFHPLGSQKLNFVFKTGTTSSQAITKLAGAVKQELPIRMT